MSKSEVLCPAGCGTQAYEVPGTLGEYDLYRQDHPDHVNVWCPQCSIGGGPEDVLRFVEYWQEKGLTPEQIKEKVDEMKGKC